MLLLLTALAGGAGGAARFSVDTWVAGHNRLSLPVGTWVVNASACLLLGFVTGALASHASWQDLQQVLGMGFLGGYSTFSTASVEGARLMAEGRYWAGLVHAGGMLLSSLVLATLGVALGAAV